MCEMYMLYVSIGTCYSDTGVILNFEFKFKYKSFFSKNVGSPKKGFCL